MGMKKSSRWILIIVNIFIVVSGERIRDKLFDPITGASCFRRLNGTHQTGCSSSQSGSVGVLHLIKFDEDLDFLLNSPPAPPYAAVIPPHLFTRRNMMRLKNEAGPGNVSVVLLINDSNSKLTNFSNELRCPNQYSGLLLPNSSITATCNPDSLEDTWNPYGSGLLHEDFPFPIFYIADMDEIDKIVNCFEKFNNFHFETQGRRRLCAVEINSFMSAAVNSEVCMRRTNFVNNLSSTRYCDPLEGRNIYATLFPRNFSTDTNLPSAKRKINTSERFILVTCRLDTTSMFDGLGLGALDSLFGYATLVGMAHMLSKLLPEPVKTTPENGLNVLFVVFDGESYDYIGSQRFVYDLDNFAFPTRSTHTDPISFENIEFMLDIGVLDTITKLQLHSIADFAQSKEILRKLQRSSEKYDLKINFSTVTGYHIPPTSAQSFLRKNISFPVIVLNSQPLNKFYHSIFDDAANANFTYGNTSLDYTKLTDHETASLHYHIDSPQMKIRNISSALALALYEILTGSVYNDSKLASPVLIDEMLYCFLESADCPLFRAASHPNSLPGLPIPPLRYVSVAGAPQEASGWTYRLLGYILSQKRPNVSQEYCNHLPLHWFAGYSGKGECRQTTQNYSQALSPAFLLNGYDWKSGQYSTWTESTWSQFSARIFLRPSKIHEIVTLSIGVVILIISICLVYVMNKRSEILFENASRNADTLTDSTAC